MVVPMFRSRGRFSSASPPADEGNDRDAKKTSTSPSPSPDGTVSPDAAPGSRSLFHNLFRRHSDAGKTSSTSMPTPTGQDASKGKHQVCLPLLLAWRSSNGFRVINRSRVDRVMERKE